MFSRSVIPVIGLALLAMALSSQASDVGAPDFELYMKGRYVFERNCIICHGPRGDGNGEMAKDLRPKPRSFREGLFKFRTTPWKKLPTDDDLRHTITSGLSGTAMGMFSHLAPEDVEAVIVYVKSFSRRWRKAENYGEPMTFPDPPEWLQSTAKAEHATKGNVLFEAVCATCHGPKADGKGPTAPTLKDVWGIAVTPSDLRQPHLRCGDAPDDIYRVIATGLNGTPMISFDQALTPAQRWDIIAYVLSLRLPPVPVLGSAPPRQATTIR